MEASDRRVPGKHRSMDSRNIILIGAPVDSGKRRRGCLMGPDAYRVAGLAEALGGRALVDRVANDGSDDRGLVLVWRD